MAIQRDESHLMQWMLRSVKRVLAWRVGLRGGEKWTLSVSCDDPIWRGSRSHREGVGRGRRAGENEMSRRQGIEFTCFSFNTVCSVTKHA